LARAKNGLVLLSQKILGCPNKKATNFFLQYASVVVVLGGYFSPIPFPFYYSLYRWPNGQVAKAKK
jgi:hypothetical protein